MSLLFLFYLFSEGPDQKNPNPIEEELSEEYENFDAQIKQDSLDFNNSLHILDI